MFKEDGFIQREVLFQSLKLIEWESDIVEIKEEIQPDDDGYKLNLIAKVLASWERKVNCIQVIEITYNFFQIRFTEECEIEFVISSVP